MTSPRKTDDDIKKKEDESKVNESALRGYLLETNNSIDNEFYNKQDQSTTYFYRIIKPCAAFVKYPVVMNAPSTLTFGSEYTFDVKKSGDYLLHLTLQIQLSEVKAKMDGASTTNIAWTNRLAHQLVKDITFCVNDFDICKLDTTMLDMMSEFMVDGSKYDGYQHMIGQDASLLSPQIGERTLLLPLPLYISRDSGLALPLSAIPSSDINLKVSLRKWEDLLLFAGKTTDATEVVAAQLSNLEAAPTILSVKLIGTYAVCGQYELDRTSCGPRLLLFEKPQYLVNNTFAANSTSEITVEGDKAKGSHRAVFFAVKNTSYPFANSLYKDAGTTVRMARFQDGGNDILKTVSIYFNTERLTPELPIEYFAYEQPYRSAKRVPINKGMYMYAFALDLCDVDPNGGLHSDHLRKRIGFKLKHNPKTTGTYQFVAIVYSHMLGKVEGKNFNIIHKDDFTMK